MEFYRFFRMEIPILQNKSILDCCMSTLREWKKLAWFGTIAFTLFTLMNFFQYTKNQTSIDARNNIPAGKEKGHLKTIIDMLCPNSGTLCTERIEMNGKEDIFSDFSEKLRRHVEQCIEKLQKFPPVTYKQTLLTLFTTWDHHDSKKELHENTVRNWLAFGPSVKVIVFSANPETRIFCEKIGCNYQYITVQRVTGVPLLKSMYLEAQKSFDSFFYAFANADILFEANLIKTLERVLYMFNNTEKAILIIGQRTNVMNVTKEEAVPVNSVTKIALNRGTIFRTDAEDYFITSKPFPWKAFPDFIVGSPAYDNWLVAYAIHNNFLTIDATNSIIAVHQTTRSGNYDGHHKHFTDYNLKLIRKIRSRVNVLAGHTICTKYFAQKDFCGLTEIIQRRTNPCAKPKSRRG
ncbi:uncharacterized protein LOC115217102 isoform X2 [Octopus sinensis]|uniref:Uncharacterized protein LOC115217102 isoform X2 n=1 Tax=Octopus sinensis TaxID=2607531 RepID=A0A7E6F746_9MOLL|nr:uncharacterized protein LOC115217102 isoform X2 [Octopus sinensis]